MLDVFSELNRRGSEYILILVCRENEWKDFEHPCKNAPWLEVHHTSGNGLVELYKRASVAFNVGSSSYEYSRFAISVKVFDYLDNCDCFVLVSRYETFGVVFAESMYCGKPVIANATGGPDSFINKKNGILVSVENIDETAAALDFVLNNYRQFDSEYIRGFAKENFAPDVICKQLYNVYREVINK